MAQQYRIGKKATTIRVNPVNGMTEITYHSTVVVVAFNDKKIVLNSGGWRTATTKTRMNQAANQFNLGFYVYQKAGEWFVNFGPRFGQDKAPINFLDGMEIRRIA